MKNSGFILSVSFALGLLTGCDANKASKAVTNDHPEQQAPNSSLQQRQDIAISADTDSANLSAPEESPERTGQSQGQADQPVQPNQPQGQ